MYKYLIGFVLGMPLIGIWLVEHGEYAMTIGVPGEPNGATGAFAAYASAVVLVALLSGRRYLGKPTRSLTRSHPNSSRREFTHFAKHLLWLNLGFLFTMLFGFGGIAVWLGTLEKGLFRANLGPFGSLAYLMTKFAIPALFAYATMLLIRTPRGRREKWLWRANAAVIVLAGSTWGFKTTGVFMLLPAILILNWRLPLHRLVALAGFFFASLVIFFYLFDAQLMEDVDVLPFLFTRLTILQGDVAWHVWGLYSQGEQLPNYWPTLLAAVGDTALTIFGVAKEHHAEWMGYHYDWMITFLSGAPLEQIADGHSITATPFAEGIVAGGWAGVTLFSVIAGLLVGRTYYHLDQALATAQSTKAAILATYFCFHIFAWLNGGAITQLFHLSIVVYIVATYLLLEAMSLPRHRVKPIDSQALSLPAKFAVSAIEPQSSP